MKTIDAMTPGEKFLTGETPHMKLPYNLGVVSLITGELNTFLHKEDDRFGPAEILQRLSESRLKRL